MHNKWMSFKSMKTEVKREQIFGYPYVTHAINYMFIFIFSSKYT